LFFASDGRWGISEALEVDEILHVVAGCKAGGMHLVLVLESAVFDLCRYADVQMPEAGCEDVHVGNLLHDAEYGSFGWGAEGKYRGWIKIKAKAKYRGFSTGTAEAPPSVEMTYVRGGLGRKRQRQQQRQKQEQTKSTAKADPYRRTNKIDNGNDNDKKQRQ
jgi:hypothetical protein